MGQVKVVLSENVENLGNKLDLVTVKRGYAVNFLLPEGLAELATPGLIERANKEREKIESTKALMIKEAAKTQKEIEGKIIKFSEKVSDKGHLYGSITEKDIADKLTDEFNVTIDPSAVKLDKHIKEIGSFEVKVELSSDITVSVSIEVEKE